MTSPLINKVQEVIWGEEDDVYRAVRALVLQEMKYRIFPGVIWNLAAWARCKAKEHGILQSNIHRILHTMQQNVEDEDISAVENLSIHHAKMSRRYALALHACSD